LLDRGSRNLKDQDFEPFGVTRIVKPTHLRSANSIRPLPGFLIDLRKLSVSNFRIDENSMPGLLGARRGHKKERLSPNEGEPSWTTSLYKST
jgi:hypothetical protein